MRLKGRYARTNIRILFSPNDSDRFLLLHRKKNLASIARIIDLVLVNRYSSVLGNPSKSR